MTSHHITSHQPREGKRPESMIFQSQVRLMYVAVMYTATMHTGWHRQDGSICADHAQPGQPLPQGRAGTCFVFLCHHACAIASQAIVVTPTFDLCLQTASVISTMAKVQCMNWHHITSHHISSHHITSHHTRQHTSLKVAALHGLGTLKEGGPGAFTAHHITSTAMLPHCSGSAQ